ncbi:MerR family transcriptional regulator [Solirubrobacter phytolaccae]|uniref:MerR family transcriptional regulator n=1 Tax=Solirubrobacter phytolaccae TaxID=1404360 RepID=A0A9X3N3M7_9ACTN|nr:MerR family transcriptional regulator [Solirubrobacter phytolaccae]MDA0179245.1 MerR family transcriptional regulator [Solirubrobacter phytolaccae]
MTALLSIGELASRTGLPVRTIRFYSDAGVVPETERTEAGYRLYGEDALVRLGLVRTLRDLGIDLATIRRVLEREVSVPDVAAAHAAALAAQIRVLRVQKAVLEAVARKGSDPQEMQRMHKLAQLSDDERKRIVAGFLDDAFDGLDMEPGFAAHMRSVSPDLPEDPTPEQVDAWIELAELVQEPDFKASIRRMSEQHATAREAGERLAPDAGWQRAAELVSEHAGSALAAGLDPASDEAAAVVDEVHPVFPGALSPAALADRLEVGLDPRAERYWQLLAIINGWPPVPTTVPAWAWFVAALRERG